ncbi:beta-ketoacyl synthase N-terminal-like domain-containing protein [Clostridium beijerinckii]|uniref:3-oxoacyl-(Acyl-carrier-protein) synthase/acyl carrier protein n=2 Tax=Clostridium beijerinckii TaxID=1520 RepID=A0AAE5H4D8_CLOBE|nr:beta-ketoacyl synthase N-terminal-like domain-containing protein [Clostridium beijerinckii]AYK27033.1 undefined polyketide synthase [Clostridium beijerinckii NRRL B-598]NSB14166.1 3-oxoacyl-(acyl-carrier-protein) synthase/acyl carrier protein [Clostridium beijerinckii]OOM30518.1 polyketide synthase PksL [Clostridium beijerinckii]
MEELKKKEIAIIGMSVDFPMSESLDELWKNIMSERSFIKKIPSNRWSEYNVDSSENINSEKSEFFGGFVDDIDCFDASFFNISPREAMFMDPQQRMSMQLAWKAIEDAGYKINDLKKSKTGVFMAVCNTDYSEMIERFSEKIDAYIPTGTSNAIVSNRISYWFDFNGPSMTIDAACASSLVAVQQAVRSIESGDCQCALVGGVNLCWSPRRFIALSKSGMLSKTGVCSAFDEKADGYTRAEGGAIIILKSLDEAIKDNDHIYGVIKGIGTNHGGRTNSLTITNAKAHSDLIAEVYKKAGVSPETVGYIETHGPGTQLGDPIEIHGLKKAFNQLASYFDVDMERETCGLGSIKTNIGHMESVAGLAGMIKVLAAMKNKIIPATINFENLNPMIKLEDSPFYIANKARDWKRNIARDGKSVPRRAGVSSFGFGGTNSHIVLEEYISNDSECSSSRRNQLIPLSAKSTNQLNKYAEVLMQYLKNNYFDRNSIENDLNINNIAYTLQLGREEMEKRAIFLADSIEEFISVLEAFCKGRYVKDKIWIGESKKLNNLNDNILELIENTELDKVAQYWVQGFDIDWKDFNNKGICKKISLPTYVFAKEHYWIPGMKIEITCNNQKEDSQYEEIIKVESNSASIRLRNLNEINNNFYQGVKAKPIIKLEAIIKKVQSVNKKEKIKSSIKKEENISLNKLISELKISLAEVLYISDKEIGINTKFVDIGLDSIIAVEWIRIINKKYKTNINAANVYDYPTINNLAEFLRNQMTIKEDIIPNKEIENKEKSVTAYSKSESKSIFKLEPLSEVEKKNKVNEEKTSLKDINNSAEDSVISIRELQKELKESLEEVLYIADKEIDTNIKFVEMGLDSIIAVEWIKVINKKYKTNVNAANVYDYPTINDLAGFLRNQITIKEDVISNKEIGNKEIKIDVYSKPKSKPVIKLVPLLEDDKEKDNINEEKVSLDHMYILEGKCSMNINDLQGELKESLAEVLYITGKDIDSNAKFIEIGLDSIIAVEWVRIINKKYKININAANVYDYPNISELSQYIMKYLNESGEVKQFSLDEVFSQVYEGRLDIKEAEVLIKKLNLI